MAFNKKIKKLSDGCCFFCKEANYALLDCHRIVEGSKYEHGNTVTLCANCHRRVHAGEITIDRRYLRSDGKWVLHYWKDNKEFYE